MRESMPDAARGVLWMAMGCVFFAAMNGIIREVSTTLDPLVVVFFRNLFGLLFVLPWLAKGGFAPRTRRLPLHLVRSLLGLVSMMSWFIALSRMNLADAVALSFTAPLFATIAAVFLLGEVVRARRWSAVAVGFLGAMIILRPGVQAITTPALLALGSAALMAINLAIVKMLTATEKPATIVFYMALILTPVSLIPALVVWRMPEPGELAWLAALGACGTLGQLCTARAFTLADATAVLPVDFLRLPLVAAIGYLAFGEALDIWTAVGAAVIIGSSVYIAHREAHYRRPVTVPPFRPEAAPAEVAATRLRGASR